MKVVYCNPVGRSGTKRVVDVILISDTTPETLPTTGAGIPGLSEDCIFAPFSVLYVVEDAPTKIYVADESGHFVPQ